MAGNKMKNIRFSHNWNNKLDQTIFTTIRKYDFKKWNYYKAQENKEFEVWLNGRSHCKATLINADFDLLEKLPVGLICSDTGMEPEEAKKLFKKFGIDKHYNVIVLTFKRGK